MKIRLDTDNLREYVLRNRALAWPATPREQYEMASTYINNLNNVELLELIEQSGCIVDDSQASSG